MKKIYLAGPMTGVPFFNFPAFYKAAEALRSAGHEVFNPAERDNERHGTDISTGNVSGCPKQAEAEHGLTLRQCLRDDTAYICEHATTIALLPGWENSKGCKAEHALAAALGLEFIYLG
ncbi:DUF4406 domain-containing protein [Pannonibacter sp. SL95]|uniref:DUF4406 domain-containing protein n=1 Tax=Pannonibacter sp. SL95 TaxID=2995153 RepID=UPI00227562D6|nr:DUF4406 domain-containing protein [Pannonibacter sp. SL95]MCY1708374.1 DUF4406 domain-containing protein [Pannonibacter sp. SL95]